MSIDALGVIDSDMPYFIILLGLISDDLTCQGVIAATRWVNAKNLHELQKKAWISSCMYKFVPLLNSSGAL